MSLPISKSNGLPMLNSQSTTPAFLERVAAAAALFRHLKSTGNHALSLNPAEENYSLVLFPDKQQNEKLAHRIGCGCFLRVLGFLRPEKF